MKIKAVDVYIQSATLPKFEKITDWTCTDVFNRGTRVGPEGKISCHMTDVFQCRFTCSKGDVENKEVLGLLDSITQSKVVWSDVHMLWSDAE